MSIIDRILEMKNTNEVQIFTSATTTKSTGYKTDNIITEVSVMLLPYKRILMEDISVVLYKASFIF